MNAAKFFQEGIEAIQAAGLKVSGLSWHNDDNHAFVCSKEVGANRKPLAEMEARYDIATHAWNVTYRLPESSLNR